MQAGNELKMENTQLNFISSVGSNLYFSEVFVLQSAKPVTGGRPSGYHLHRMDGVCKPTSEPEVLVKPMIMMMKWKTGRIDNAHETGTVFPEMVVSLIDYKLLLEI